MSPDDKNNKSISATGGAISSLMDSLISSSETLEEENAKLKAQILKLTKENETLKLDAKTHAKKRKRGSGTVEIRD